MHRNTVGMVLGLGVIGAMAIAGLIVEISASIKSPTVKETPITDTASAEARAPEAPPPVPPQATAVLPGDLGGGITFPLGETLEVFLRSHPDARCFDAAEGRTCEIANPLPSDCPSTQPCDDAMYEFKNGTLVGFVVSYLKDDWNILYKAIAEKYGAPKIRETPITPPWQVGDRVSEWKVQGGYLTCMMFFGDLENSPIKIPFAVSFAPESGMK